jgi:transcriptional regulator with XRE-family HTH domain
MSRHSIITDRDNFSKALRDARKNLGLKQSDVADLYNLSRYTIVDVESGKGDPKLSTILTLLEAVGMRLVVVPAEVSDRISMPPESDHGETNFLGEVDWDSLEG